MGQHLLRRQVQIGERLDRGAQPSHGGGAVDAVAGDVAHDEGDPGAGQRDDVEPVAAEARQLVRGPVAGGDVHRVLLGQVARQQTPLKHECGVAFACVAAGVVHADRGPGDELLRERQILRVERVGAVAPEEAGDTHRDAARADRHDHHRVQPELDERDPRAAGVGGGPVLVPGINLLRVPGLATGQDAYGG